MPMPMVTGGVGSPAAADHLDAPSARPTADRLARARCLVPLLGHVAVRLASLAPVRAAIGEVAARRLGKDGDGSSTTGTWGDCGAVGDGEGEGMQEVKAPGDGGAQEEALAAAEDVLAQADAISCFAGELTELCGAEGQWLAALAMAPKVTQKFIDDFGKLANGLDGVARQAGGSDHVAAQPAAATGGAGAHVLQERGGPFGDHGHAAALHAMLTTAIADLRADLDGEAFLGCKARLGPELEIARELQFLLETSHIGSDGKSSSSDQECQDRQAVLERIANFGGTIRSLPAVGRELEAAQQFCRVLAGTSGPPTSSRAGGEARAPSGGRDALVSEAQASGGSALHRWIRAQVTEPQLHNNGSVRGVGGATAGSGQGGTGGSTGSGAERFSVACGRPSFVEHADIPHEFLCPITQDVMRDAVSTCDGHTYERRNIEAWLAENSSSPITGLCLANKTLIPNHNLRKLILDSGVLSRLGPDAKPDSEGPQFRDRVCCEIVVPRDVATLSEALVLGTSCAAREVGTGTQAVRGSRIPSFGIRLLTGEHALLQTLQIDQDVEILGEGTSGTVLRLAIDATLEIKSGARLANVAICRDAAATAGTASVGGSALNPRVSSARTAALLEIGQGSCRVEHCDLSNAVGSAIKVSGAHTSPTIARSTIHGCRDPGVVFQDGADGVLTACRLFGNHSVAIEVHTRADPLVEDNDIFDGRQGGVFVYNRGKGHLRRNKIFRNALEGVEIKQGGRPLVEDNDIYDNLECGIFVHNGGEGRVIGNRIHSNSYAGIEIKDASSPEIRGNDVYSGRTSGMYVHSGGQGTIEGNQIHQNLLHGVYVRNKGCPNLLKNTIFRNEECGVFITESSHPCVEHNEVHSNGLAGIEVKEESNPTIKLNRIHDGNTGGIFVLARGRGRIFENKLYKNKLEGVEIKDGGDPQVMDNEIYENMECGVFAHDGALGRIEGNRIYANAYAGVEIKDLSGPVVKGNRIYRGQTSGIYVHSGGQGKVIDNVVHDNGLHGVMILSGGHPAMSRNKVHDNAECGVVCHVSYALDSTSNQIFSNRVKNIQTVRS